MVIDNPDSKNRLFHESCEYADVGGHLMVALNKVEKSTAADVTLPRYA
jgi:hypothetical protein